MGNSVFTPVRETGDAYLSLLGEQNPEAYLYIRDNINLDYEELTVLETSTRFNIRAISEAKVDNIVNLKPLNDIRYINKFIEAVNGKLSTNGMFIGCFESKEQRKDRIFRKFPAILAFPFYVLDFLWKRVLPKLYFTKKLYFSLTRGLNRVLSLPETLGRLVSCGFKIVDYKEINGKTFFTARKIKKPAFDHNPTYGALITLKRVGLNGNLINVYKLRTMHPYAEYLQEFIYEQNSVENGGKFRDDFRITHWGAIFRKFWLDELPMLFNWIKGDLKLVGVRPLSQHYFELYPKSLQERRVKYKPGLIPPYYVDLPSSMDEIFASEKKYMMQYDKSPFTTDIKYFFKSLYNIFIKRARSK